MPSEDFVMRKNDFELLVPACPDCEAFPLEKDEVSKVMDGGILREQSYLCSSCGRLFTVNSIKVAEKLMESGLI